MPTDEQIEKAAKAMCVAAGEDWEATTSAETHSGNMPGDMREGWRDLAAAALSAAEAQEVKPRVKPLKWMDCADGTTHDTNRQYEIDFTSGYFTICRAVTGGGSYLAQYRNLDDAKAAAQADYEARILGALE